MGALPPEENTLHGLKQIEFLLLPLRSLNQRPQGFDRDSKGPAGESVHVGRIDADHFALGIEYRTAASAMRGGRIVNQLIADYVTQMPARG